MINNIESVFSDAVKPERLPSDFWDPQCGEKESLEYLIHHAFTDNKRTFFEQCAAAWPYFDASFLNFYLPIIMRESLEETASSGELTFCSEAVSSIISELSYEVPVNGLTYDFRKKWGGLTPAQVDITKTWIKTISQVISNEIDYNLTDVQKVLQRL